MIQWIEQFLTEVVYHHHPLFDHLVEKKKNRLVESCSKWGERNFHGMCLFHFHGYFHRDEYKPKGLELRKEQKERTFSFWKFRLGILDYLQEIPFSP